MCQATSYGLHDRNTVLHTYQRKCPPEIHMFLLVVYETTTIYLVKISQVGFEEGKMHADFTTTS